jgi:hypothetical protein
MATLSIQAQTTAQPDPNAMWQQDLQVLVDALNDPKTGQLDFAKLYPPRPSMQPLPA